MASMQFKVCSPGGEQFEISLAASDKVQQLREAVETKKGELQPATCLKLMQGGRVLLDDADVSELSEEAPVLAIVTRETRLDILLHASGHCNLYKELLGSASREEGSGSTSVVGPFPTILAVLEELKGEKQDMEHLKPGATDGWLEFSGEDGDLLLPSLDAGPLLAAVGSAAPLEAVTLSVGVNSDAYNRGLGIVVEASPLVEVPAEQPEAEMYTYNGYGLQNEGRQRNAVKFHPGMGGGQLRVEGAGGFHNSDVDFTPKSWSESGGALHTLEVTLRTDGSNVVRLLGSGPEEEERRGAPPAAFSFLGGSLLCALLMPRRVCLTAMLGASLGDPAAAIVGTLLDGPRLVGSKTLSGFCACLVVAGACGVAADALTGGGGGGRGGGGDGSAAGAAAVLAAGRAAGGGFPRLQLFALAGGSLATCELLGSSLGADDNLAMLFGGAALLRACEGALAALGALGP